MSGLVRSSLTSRRFPALRGLSSDDVEVFSLPSERKTNRSPGHSRLFDLELMKPSVTSLGRGGSPVKSSKMELKAAKDRPPFRPSNKTQARDDITLEGHVYVAMHSPYDMAHNLHQSEVKESGTRAVNPIFLPNAPAKAREAVRVNYYLNSPDAETIEAERRYIRDKAAKNLLDYQRRMKANIALQRSATEHT